MLEAERFKEVLVDNVRAGGDDRVHHMIADEIDDHILQAGRDERASQAQDYAALRVAQHHVVDRGRTRQITRRIRHVPHGIDQRHNVVILDLYVLDGLVKKFLFCWHPASQFIAFQSKGTRVFVKFV